jgi:hypothetical protein
LHSTVPTPKYFAFRQPRSKSFAFDSLKCKIFCIVLLEMRNPLDSIGHGSSGSCTSISPQNCSSKVPLACVPRATAPYQIERAVEGISAKRRDSRPPPTWNGIA